MAISSKKRIICLLLIIGTIIAALPMMALAAYGNEGFEMIDGKLYYYENGERKFGWVPAYIYSPGMKDYQRMYLYEDGTWATGWFKYGGYWYFLHVDGSTHIGMLQFNADTVYEMDLNGRMITGWYKYQSIPSTPWYYFNKNGKRHNGWLKEPIDNNWYYLNSFYGAQTGWLKIKGIWYYFDANGIMKTGWVNDKGKWYYMESSGAMKTGWLKDNGKWYYLDNSGCMATGTRTISGRKYTFDSNGKLL